MEASGFILSRAVYDWSIIKNETYNSYLITKIVLYDALNEIILSNIKHFFESITKKNKKKKKKKKKKNNEKQKCQN